MVTLLLFAGFVALPGFAGVGWTLAGYPPRHVAVVVAALIASTAAVIGLFADAGDLGAGERLAAIAMFAVLQAAGSAIAVAVGIALRRLSRKRPPAPTGK